MMRHSTTIVSRPRTAFKAAFCVVAAFALVGSPFMAPKPVSAEQYDDKIAALQQRLNSYQQTANTLSKKGDSLQRQLNILSAQKSALQAKIDLNQTKHDKLQAQIVQTEQQITDNKNSLGETMVDLWVEGDTSALEMLASSDNIGDFIDKQAYKKNLRDGLSEKVKEIEELKKKLKSEQDEVKKVLDEQKLAREELASKEAAQAELVRKTRNSEAGYQRLIKSSQGQIKKFQQMQAELQRLRAQGAGGGTYITTGGSGGYPWAGVGYPCWSSSCGDPWGLYYRECVSYVAWKLSANGRGVKHFGGQGHAYQWPGTTSGYTSQSSSPKRGDAAVFPAYVNGAAWTGHVMYVEQVYGDGSIKISEYNWSGTGTYSERRLSPGEYSGTTFITFPRR